MNTTLLSRSVGSRKDRWTRIVISLVVVFPGTKAFGLFESAHRPDFIGIDQPIAYLTAVAIVVGAACILAATWAGALAEIGALLLESLISSADNRPLPQNRVRAACTLLKVHDYRQAGHMAKKAVREDPDDIDTRLIVVRILLTTGSHWSVRWHCWRVLAGRSSSPSQQSCARYLLDQIRSRPEESRRDCLWRQSQTPKLN